MTQPTIEQQRQLNDEPPHPFNSRPKAWYHTAVPNICTDCHHHESAACHQPAAAPKPGKEPARE